MGIHYRAFALTQRWIVARGLAFQKLWTLLVCPLLEYILALAPQVNSINLTISSFFLSFFFFNCNFNFIMLGYLNNVYNSLTPGLNYIVPNSMGYTQPSTGNMQNCDVLDPW